MAKEHKPALEAGVMKTVSLVSTRISGKTLARAGFVAATCLTLANCAQQPQRSAYSSQHQREFGAFSHSKYGTASPRMYADNGEALPKGGGRDLVGKTYRVAGRAYTPYERPVGASQVGLASWYGPAFHGRKTANGEVYDRRSFSAAHPTMPLPSYARVTNMRNGMSVIVRVNDRGPYHGGRIMDVSERVADALAFKSAGTGRVKVDYLGRAGLGGSDDTRLAASLRSDGAPAVADYIPASYGENKGATVAVAMAEPVASAPPARPAAFTPRRAEPVQAREAAEAEEAPVQAAATSAQRPGLTASALAPVAQPPKAVETASQLPAKAPLPPARPFDLGTIPGANTPQKAPPRTASLSFAPQATGISRFQQAHPLANLQPAKFSANKQVHVAAKD